MFIKLVIMLTNLIIRFNEYNEDKFLDLYYIERQYNIKFIVFLDFKISSKIVYVIRNNYNFLLMGYDNDFDYIYCLSTEINKKIEYDKNIICDNIDIYNKLNHFGYFNIYMVNNYNNINLITNNVSKKIKNIININESFDKDVLVKMFNNIGIKLFLFDYDNNIILDFLKKIQIRETSVAINIGDMYNYTAYM
jgi:hypothetical protein